MDATVAKLSTSAVATATTIRMRCSSLGLVVCGVGVIDGKL